MDPNRVMEAGRPNVHAVNNMDLLNMEWLSISPQRDDLKLLCEQNVSARTVQRALRVYFWFAFVPQKGTTGHYESVW